MECSVSKICMYTERGEGRVRGWQKKHQVIHSSQYEINEVLIIKWNLDTVQVETDEISQMEE